VRVVPESLPESCRKLRQAIGTALVGMGED
jgi:hypothetical protein